MSLFNCVHIYFYLYLLSSLEEVYYQLQKDLIRNAGLAIWYGEEVLLHQCYITGEERTDEHGYRLQGGNVIETYNLLPSITFYVGDFPPIKFNSKNQVIGYDTKKNFTDSGNQYDPIDFSVLNTNEVNRYLNHDLYLRFHIMHEKGLTGSNMDSYPPNVGVQIDLTSVTRNEGRFSFRKLTRVEIDLGGDTYILKPGFNSLD